MKKNVERHSHDLIYGTGLPFIWGVCGKPWKTKCGSFVSFWLIEKLTELADGANSLRDARGKVLFVVFR
jgi:hypothetical protein